jgi:molybdenum cofactor biosynthesis protein B
MHEEDFPIKVGVITISSSRFERYGHVRGLGRIHEVDDPSGKEIVESLGFDVVDYALVPDDVEAIRKTISEMLEGVDAVVTTGGTGVTPTDVTIEAVEPIIQKRIDGFGEIFRYLSYQEAGAKGMLSRTFAGIIDGKAIFCLPGSRKAVKLGSKLIRESLRHILTHARGLK